jgi:hypothetical protein
MRRANVLAAISFLGFGAALAVACTSSSNSAPPSEDASFDFDAAGFDTGVPPSEDSASPEDAGHDATVNDAGPPEGGNTPVDASDASEPDATDSAVADASEPDAADSAVADAGPGTVTSPSGLQLTVFRQGHTATLLNDGRVLFCGGYYTETSALDSCDLFDPTTTTITAGPAMHYGRQYHSATVLANGQVLIAGGDGPSQTDGGGTYGVLQSAEIFDPTASTFTVVSNLMQSARAGQPAILLPSGPRANQVLLFGGTTYDVATSTYVVSPTAEAFDPGDASTSGTFTTISPQMHFARSIETAAALLLADGGGGVLVAGGVGPVDGGWNGETIDPALSAFTFTANAMSSYHEEAYSTTLPDGRIFIAGGVGVADGSTADIYDPTTRTFSTVTLPSARWYSPVTTLKSGRVLFAGGYGPSGTLGDVLVYDPTSNEFFEATGALSVPRSIPTVTTLQDGRVIIAGGQNASGIVVPTVDIFTE